MGLLPVRLVMAHAELVSADPAPGATLEAAPAEIRLTFSEPLEAGSTVILFGEEFQAVSGVSFMVDPGAPEQLVAFPPVLAPGIYTVQWKAATKDAHEVSGSYSFSVATTNDIAPLGSAARIGIVAVAVIAAALLYRRVRKVPKVPNPDPVWGSTEGRPEGEDGERSSAHVINECTSAPRSRGFSRNTQAIPPG